MRHKLVSPGTPTIATLGRTLELLEAILANQACSSVAAIGAGLGLPRSTAHRQITTLVQEGMLSRLINGYFIAGPRLVALLQMADHRQILVAAATPVLRRLAKKLHCVAQLGTLDNDMVTYHTKMGQGADEIFTRIGLQLEAYCTGIGKVMLAHLPECAREAYLAAGPFPALTTRTITDATCLRAELSQVRAQGYACDNGEIAEHLVCYAVPLCRNSGEVVAAISVSTLSDQWNSPLSNKQLINSLLAAAVEIQTIIQAAGY